MSFVKFKSKAMGVDLYIKPEAVIAVLPAGGGSEIVLFSKDVYTVTSQPETVMKRLHDYKESWSHLNDKDDNS